MEKFAEMKTTDVLKQFESSLIGLTEEEATNRLEKYGFNELKERKKTTPAKILLRQLGDLMVWVLFAAALTSYFIGETINFWAITVIIIFIIILGFVQEFKEAKAMAV